MRGHGLRGRGPACTLVPQVVRELFGEGPRIREDHRRPVPGDRSFQPAQQPAIAQSAMRRFIVPDQALNLDFKRRSVRRRGGVYDAAAPSRPDQKPRGRVTIATRRRQPYANRFAPGLGRQPFE